MQSIFIRFRPLNDLNYDRLLGCKTGQSYSYLLIFDKMFHSNNNSDIIVNFNKNFIQLFIQDLALMVA